MINTGSKFLSVLIVLALFVSATVVSYTVIDHYYGSEFGIYSKPPRPAVGSENEARLVEEDVQMTPKEKRIDALPLSLGFGVSIAAVALAAWIGSKRAHGDGIVSVINKDGISDLSVENLEIILRVMDIKKFTIQELAKDATLTRQAVWLLVRKLIEHDLVKETGDKKLPESGRGRPSKVYEYVGP